jgi:hypothetical protein
MRFAVMPFQFGDEKKEIFGFANNRALKTELNLIASVTNVSPSFRKKWRTSIEESSFSKSLPGIETKIDSITQCEDAPDSIDNCTELQDKFYQVRKG